MEILPRSLNFPPKYLIRKLVFVFAIIALTTAEKQSEKKAKSLFDALPLNGAIPTKLNSEDFVQNEVKKVNPPKIEKILPKINSVKKEEVKSLFDQLPDQGAMDSGSSATKSQAKGPDSNTRSQRHSLSSELSPPNRFGGDEFEIEHKPAADINLSFFNSNVLPPILRSLTQDEQRTGNSQYGAPVSHSTIPILTNSNSQNSGYESNLPPGAEPALFRGIGPSSFSGEKFSNAVRVPDSSYKTPSSGGSTVIVYTNNPPNSDSLSTPSGDYGPPKDVPKGKDESSKSEIHYHYHINNDPGKQAPNTPSDSYGQPVPPVRSSYESPRLRKPPGNAYLPPSRTSSGGYSEAPQDTPGVFPPAPPSSDEEIPDVFPPAPPNIPQDTPSSYGYGPPGQVRPPSQGSSRPRPGHSRPRPPSHGHSRPRPPSHGHSRPRPPSRPGHGHSRPPSQGPLLPSSQGQSQGYGYSGTGALADEEVQTEDQRTEALHHEDFQSRTLLTGSHDTSNRHLSRPGSSQYGVPSTSYGPPSPVYGPPDTSPPAPNDQGIPGQGLTQLTQTSITLETIPITTTETRLVTVPKITQTLGSTKNQFDGPVPPQNSPPFISGGYSSGGQSSGSNAGPPAPPSALTSTRNILNEQLLQLSPSSSQQSDFSDIDILALLQSQDNPTDILNPQGGSVLGNGFRSSGISELRNGAGLSSRNLGAGFLRDLQLGNGQQSGYSGLRGSTPFLTGDSIAALSDLIREQRQQQSASQLRQRLRSPGREADRTRQTYRNLFYKGALLLGGLSLIPSVANLGPLAAGASSSLLPLAGRRKRSIENSIDRLSIRTCLELPPLVIPMPQNGSRSLSILTVRRRNCKDSAKRVSFRGTFKNKLGNKGSLLDSMPFKGALIPQEVQAELERYFPMEEILQNNQCIQRYFCENLLEMRSLKKPDSALLLLSALTRNAEKNPWVQEAMTAAKNYQCGALYCHVKTAPNIV